MQTTVAATTVFSGRGLHSGRNATAIVRPAPAGCGILFRRTDLDGTPEVQALWSNVEVSPLNTRLKGTGDVTVSTIEHLMAALAGTGVHNAIVELDGPEVPILDGSAAPFVRGLLASGLRRLSRPLQVIEVLRGVEVARADGAWVRLDPAISPMMTFEIDFPDAAIGHQAKSLNLANGAFVRELCDSRTFCRRSDIDAMRQSGLALGGTFENAVVVDGGDVLSPGGLRRDDEAVRHKMLDALGDLYTAGAPILGHYRGYKAGHAMTNAVLKALFADPANYRRITSTPAIAARLPGCGVSPADLSAVA